MVTTPVGRDRLTLFDDAVDAWKLVPGSYSIMAGGFSPDLSLHEQIALR